MGNVLECLPMCFGEDAGRESDSARLTTMENDEMKKKCEQLLQELGLKSFIVFGFEKGDGQFGVVSSYHKMPKGAAIKGMSWALNDFAQKNF